MLRLRGCPRQSWFLPRMPALKVASGSASTAVRTDSPVQGRRCAETGFAAGSAKFHFAAGELSATETDSSGNGVEPGRTGTLERAHRPLPGPL